MEKSKEIEKNWTRAEKCEIRFGLFLDLYYKNSISGAETWHWFLSPPSFEIFLMFTNFLRSYILHRLATREATLIEFFYTSYQALLYLWRNNIFFIPNTLNTCFS